MMRGGVSEREDSPSLDRLDSSLGYTPENVWWISYRANRLKNDSTLEELEKLVKAIRKVCTTREVPSVSEH